MPKKDYENDAEEKRMSATSNRPAHAPATGRERAAKRKHERAAINSAAKAMAARIAANARESINAIMPDGKETDGKSEPGHSVGSHRRSPESQKAPTSTSAARKAHEEHPSSEENPTFSSRLRHLLRKVRDHFMSEEPPRRRWLAIVLRVLLAVFAIVALVLLCSEKWLFNNWAALSVDEIIYHLRASLAGTNTSTITNYIVGYGTIELIVSAGIIAALIFTWKRCKPVVQRIVMCAILAFSIGATAHAILDFDSRVHFFDYFSQLSQRTAAGEAGGEAAEDDFVAVNYVDPAQTVLGYPENKRNLIFIYLESMELTFTDEAHGGAFAKDVIPELTALAEEGECFAGNGKTLNGGYTFPGTTWTTGAMFGVSSGAPLKLPFITSELSSDADFFPGMIMLGDILADEGYTQELMIGSDAAFGGRDLLYRQHGDFALLDYNYAIDQKLIPEDYFVWWGYEDSKLFSFARTELTRLAGTGEPFNFTMLTVDTHFPDGWECPLCENTFDDQYSNVYACSSKQVESFVRWIQKQDFYKNTTIVITGDHPTMDADYCNDVPSDYVRRVYSVILNPAPEALDGFDASQRREYSTMDLFPTTLAALGTKIDGNRLGLGSNLFSDVPTLIERYGLQTCEVELEKPSAFLDGFMDTKITATNMVNARSSDWVNAIRDENGAITFELVEYILKKGAVNDVKITISDDRTGFSRALPTTVVEDPADPNILYYAVRTNLTDEDLPYLTLTVTLSTDNFKNYPICTVKGEDLLPHEESDEESEEESYEEPEEAWDETAYVMQKPPISGNGNA